MTNIGWTNETWNCLTGCTPVSHGCTNCYAAQLAATRLKDLPKYKGLAVLNSRGQGVFTGKVLCHEKDLLKPLSWRKPKMIFVNSMSDVFHEDVPFEFIDKMFAVMALCPQHNFQVLTKRPERMAEYFSEEREGLDCVAYRLTKSESLAQTAPSYEHPLPNVWLGTSCENQETADQRIPHLLNCPAAVRFLSCEPLIGGIDLSDIHSNDPNIVYRPLDGRMWGGIPGGEDHFPDQRIHWVIVGGESGPSHRAMEMEWARSLIGQCKAANVPVYVKQDSSYRSEQKGRFTDEEWALKEFPNQ